MIRNKIKGLGEVIIRVKDLAAVTQFYEELIGLEVLEKGPRFVFFKLADGFEGHPQILGLFDQSALSAFEHPFEKPDTKRSSLHHFALEIDKRDYDAILNYLTSGGVPVKTRVFNWIQWKSIYLQDPEQNVVELVCYDPTIEKKD